MASLKVQCALGYQAVVLGASGSWAARSCAQRVTSENRPSKAGVVRMHAHGLDPRDRDVGPLALGLDTEMGTAFLERDLELPARDEPPEDIDRSGVEIGAAEGLPRGLAARIADQQPADRKGRHHQAQPAYPACHVVLQRRQDHRAWLRFHRMPYRC
jgi:hypothetical protein